MAQTALGGLGHHAPKAGCCDLCGVETAFVADQIARLQTCPCGKDRDHAAHRLRHVDWRSHPEVDHALAGALLHDCDEEVREEAAQSLTKLAPCLAEAHAALCLAAKCDPHLWTRHWARKCLAKLHRRCDDPCVVCTATRASLVSPQTLTEPALAPVGSVPLPEPMSPASGLRFDEVPADLTATIPGTSPFASGPQSPAISLGRPARRLNRPNLAPWLRGSRSLEDLPALSH